ncbi:N-6 DNA methylase [Nocardiopsis nanhaiensis]
MPSPHPRPHGRAHAIAEAVDQARHRTHGTGHPDIALSTVAALALLAPTPAERAPAVQTVTGWNTDQVGHFVRRQWVHLLRTRPDLANPLAPFTLAWLGRAPMPEQAQHAAGEVARAAVRTGLFELTGHTETRRCVDLLGVVLTVLKSRTAATATGSFYTPTGVADLKAALSLPCDVRSVHEPSLGTGGLWRAMAQLMRERGQDPARVEWVGIDIDPLAIASAAVNAVLWDLGPRVVLGVGDILTSDALRTAYAQRAETTDLARTADQMQTSGRMLTALHTRTDPATRRRKNP